MSVQFANDVTQSWTLARETLLKKLLDRNLSAGEIANEMGHISRNGVIGKVRRMGLELPNHRAFVVVDGKLIKERRVKAHKPRVRSADAKLRHKIAEQQRRHLSSAERKRQTAQSHASAQEYRARHMMAATELTDLPPEDAAQAVSFFDLSASTCRWPIGNSASLDTIKFCGKQPDHDRPYCCHHWRMAHKPRGAAANG